MKQNVLATFFAIVTTGTLMGTAADAKAQSYKGFPAGYCTYYAAREFDKVAPAPQVNWHGNAAQFATNAYNAGWQVKSSVMDAFLLPLGSLVVWNDGGYGHVAVYRGCDQNGIVVDEMNWDAFNYVDRRYLTYGQVQNRGAKGTYKFAGYILPRRR